MLRDLFRVALTILLLAPASHAQDFCHESAADTCGSFAGIRLAV